MGPLFEIETDTNLEGIEVSSNFLTFRQCGNRLTFLGLQNPPFLVILIKPVLLQQHKSALGEHFPVSQIYPSSIHAFQRCMSMSSAPGGINPVTDCQPL